MKCPNCGDDITGVSMEITTSGAIYKEEGNDLGSYPELESDMAEPDTPAECMDCYYTAQLRDFFPEDPNA